MAEECNGNIIRIEILLTAVLKLFILHSTFVPTASGLKLEKALSLFFVYE